MGGGTSKGLLPTGKAVDVLDVPDYGPVEVSIVDAANPLVFVKASDLGLSGRELPEELNADEVDLKFIRIGHPSGVLECGVDYKEENVCPVIEDTFGFRTANMLMEGTATIR